VFALSSSTAILNSEWTNFFDAQPAYPYSGNTKNQRVMQSFNTPFFPDILITTSVLQEGVNLQYFCDKIIHYGIAWTPGDNEQRVGRIDRMFSKLEQKLELNENSELSIQYPYLRNTIDQDHLANFIYKKHFAENLIDKCQSYEGSANLSPGHFNYENWQDYFREPNSNSYGDPYGAKLNSLAKTTFQLELKSQDSEIGSQILNAFIADDIPMYSSDTEKDILCILDPTLDSGRKQPVIVKFRFDSKITGLARHAAHILSMVTPLGTKKELNKFINSYSKYRSTYENTYMTTKLCFDSTKAQTSLFGIYMKVEFPVFIQHIERPLSIPELMKGFNDLIQCADYIEQCVFGRDYKLSDIHYDVSPPNQINAVNLRSRTKTYQPKSPWKTTEKHVYRMKEKRSGDKWPLKEVWEWNHADEFAKYLVRGNSRRMIIPFPRMDIQKVEIDLFDRVFDYRLRDNIW